MGGAVGYVCRGNVEYLRYSTSRPGIWLRRQVRIGKV
jgi:hypothetical protein